MDFLVMVLFIILGLPFLWIYGPIIRSILYLGEYDPPQIWTTGTLALLTIWSLAVAVGTAFITGLSWYYDINWNLFAASLMVATLSIEIAAWYWFATQSKRVAIGIGYIPLLILAVSWIMLFYTE